MKTPVIVRFASLLSLLLTWMLLAVAARGQGSTEFSPDLVLTSPTNGQTFAEGEVVQLVAEAHSPDGYVLTTLFSEAPDGFSFLTSIGPVTNHLDAVGVSGDFLDYSSDAEVTLTNLSPDGYTFAAFATDTAGNKLNSAPVHIIVAAPPPVFTVSIISPTNGAIFAGPTNIEISANIGWTRGLGFPHLVTFYDGTNEIVHFVLDPGPTNFTLSYPLAAGLGVHNLTVVAQGDATDAVTSAPVSIAVVPAITSPFIATILSPTNGTVYSGPTNIDITGLFGSQAGAPFLQLLTFYDGTNVLLRLPMDPPIADFAPTFFTLTYKWAAGVGQHVLTVAVTGGGQKVTSSPVYVIIPTPPPCVSIIATQPVAVRQSLIPQAGSVHANDDRVASIPAIFTVYRNNQYRQTNSPLTVYYSIGGTASNGVDYVSIPGSVTIPVNQTSATVEINPIYPYEIPAVTVGPFGNRVATVILSLEPPPRAANPYQIGTPSKAEAIIIGPQDYPNPPTCLLPDGTFHLDIPGTNGLVYCVEASTNLMEWTPILTNTVAGGSIDFVDPDAGLFPQRFYRVCSAAEP